MPDVTDSERIELLRGGTVVSSLAGAHGVGLRETRLTAMLGYLVALEPQRFCQLFAFQGRPLSVSLETRHAVDRSDILVETSAGRGVIEAKINAVDPFRQALGYPARWRLLLTEHRPSYKQRSRRRAKYLRWCDLMPLLEQLARSKDTRVRFVSWDLVNYLKEHNMIQTTSEETYNQIYAREINDEESLAVLLKAQIYGCSYQQGSRLAEMLYFAPHFGQSIARNHPGIRAGISYIARIERVEVLETREEFLPVVRQVRGKHWVKSHMSLLRPMLTYWGWHKGKRNVVFLAPPRLVFNPPVLKRNLVKGSGMLGKRYFSFEALFSAWGC